MDIQPVTRITVTEQVLNQLGDLILKGKIKPGEKLPTERDLAAMFGTTRARVREALRALALIGLIDTRPGDGTYVAVNSGVPAEALDLMFFREARKYDDLYEARETLEPPLFVKASQYVTVDDLRELQRFLDDCEMVIKHGGTPEDFLECLDAYDQLIVKLTRNAVLETLMAVFRTMARAMYIRLLRVPGAMTNSLERRQEITEALRSRDAAAVGAAVHKHMQSARKLYHASIGKDDYEPENHQN